jgi:hypothetical protein
MPAEINPHVIMMRAIQTRAPYLTSIRLLGISHAAYARKKMPAPKPYAVSDIPRSAFICSFAKPTLTRSSHEMM